MKDYSLYRLNCDCSWRMKSRGKLVRIYKTPAIRQCPNCRESYTIELKDEEKHGN